jgi:hypothetical protein
MANEFSLLYKLTYAGKSNGSAGLSIPKETISDDQSGDNYIQGLQTVTTAYEALNVGEVSTKGHLWIFNKDASTGSLVRLSTTNDSSGVFAKVKPSAFPTLIYGCPTVYAIASSGSVNLEYYLFDA